MKNFILSLFLLFTFQVVAAPPGHVVMVDVNQSGAYTEWTPYTPTLSASFGTTSNAFFEWRREGGSIYIRGRFTVGTTTAATASITMPNSYTVDDTILQSQVHKVGTASRVGADNTFDVLATGNSNLLTFGAGTARLTSANASAILASTNSITIDAGPIPITGLTTPRVPVPVFFGPNLLGPATQTGTYTVLASDELVNLDAASSYTVTLPSAVTAGKGKVIRLVRVAGSSSNTITIATTASQTINGYSNTYLFFNGEAIAVESDGSNWKYLAPEDGKRIFEFAILPTSGSCGVTANPENIVSSCSSSANGDATSTIKTGVAQANLYCWTSAPQSFAISGNGIVVTAVRSVTNTSVESHMALQNGASTTGYAGIAQNIFCRADR